jgi:hypothetical protein
MGHRYFVSWILFMAEFFRVEFPTPSLEQINLHMPKKFDDLMEQLNLQPGRLRHIIDATEIFCQTPTDPRARRNYYSDYKHAMTVKFHGDISPQGATNFISCGHGGRTTDLELVQMCGWLEILESNTYVLADRAYIIQNLINSIETIENVTIIHPHKRFVGTEKFTAEEAKQISIIARARIHVERYFARVKQFRYLGRRIDLKQADLIGKIMYVICMQTHYMRPITNDERKGKNNDTRVSKKLKVNASE